MCNCRINSDPSTGDPETLLDQEKYFPDTKRKTVPVDACIADIIEALWAAGVQTVSCCCGHDGRIAARNGRPNVMLAGPEYAQAAYDVLAKDNRNWWVIFWGGKEISIANKLQPIKSPPG